MKAWRVALVWAVAGSVLVSGCDEDGPCCLIDVTSHVVVRGVIESPAGIPASQARLEPTGVLRYQCDVDTKPVWVRGDSAALGGPDGIAMLVLITSDGPGSHCVDLVATDEAAVNADTVRDVELDFRLLDEVPDTVEVQLVLNG